MSANDVAIAATDLIVQRGHRTVLEGLNLSIPKCQITGLLGPSGCGKTTLMRVIVGVQARVTGDVQILGMPAGSADLRRRVSYATQAVSVYDDLTVLQNLRYFASVLGVPRSDVDRVLQVVGLEAYSRHRADALSGGQRGRVSLAVALLGSPELVVLDEPTVGLDPVLRTELWALFRSLADAGVTLLVSSHVMDEALRCDRLLLMREGRVIADTTPHDMLESTGTNDPEAAFLAIVAAEDGSGEAAEPRIRRPGDAHPQHGRHATGRHDQPPRGGKLGGD